ncbi:queuosine precursor transporter [Candidatus Uhrbacteria bacterium]|jgi:queuosine precursor transporter|nr:queuosine precursor transporter [Candidatus Uhrbacteria bacterium]MBT7717205.1 queuosine precursor transporter [Candidatus Uhrbacteria bacterium]
MQKQFKLLGLFTALNIAFQLISDVTAGKIIDVFSYPVSATILYFPIVYIISDIVTEVYGYAKARRVLLITMLCSILAGLIYQLVVYLPPSVVFDANEAYQSVFGIVPRVLLGGWIAVFVGDILNNYTLAKMKVWTKGKFLWMRTISSTIVGQLGNTALFYVIALYAILPNNVLLTSIVAAWLLKVAVEVVLTPVTYIVVKWVKKVENEDHYDTDTDFNPISLQV